MSETTCDVCGVAIRVGDPQQIKISTYPQGRDEWLLIREACGDCVALILAAATVAIETRRAAR